MRGIIVSALLLILLVPAVHALKVTPASTTIEFVPNSTIEGNCNDITDPGCICLSIQGESNVKFVGRGEMAYVINSSNFKHVKTINPFECYSYDITMPALGKKAGENVVRIAAVGDASSGGSVAIVLSVDQRLIINVDPKYAEPYVPPPLDISKLLIYTSISLIGLTVILLLIRSRK